MRRFVFVLVLLLAACSNEQNQPATQQQTAAPVVKPAEQVSQEVKEAATAVKENAEQAVQQVTEQAAQVTEQVTEQVTQVKTSAEQAVQGVVGKVATATKSGETIYLANCKSCHANGLLGAPKLGDTRLQKDLETLVMNSIKGVGRMPARGGVSSLSDADVRAAVVYMVEQSK